MADPVRRALLLSAAISRSLADSGQPVGVQCDVGMGSHLSPTREFRLAGLEEANGFSRVEVHR